MPSYVDRIDFRVRWRVQCSYMRSNATASYTRTYWNVSGSPLMPLIGGAIQLASLPGS